MATAQRIEVRGQAVRRLSAFGLGGALALCACGGGDDEGGVPVGGGEVAPPWDGACVATFDMPYTFIDPFGDPELRVEQGSRYLLADSGGFGVEATVLFLGGAGPVELEIDVDGDALPFSSSCAGGRVEEVVGVFRDVTVYADEALTTSSCMLSAGSVLPGGGLSYGLVSGDLFQGGGIYQVWFGGLAAACGGVDEGYVEAATVMLGSTQYTVLPLASVLRPAP